MKEIENEFLCYCCYQCPSEKHNLKEFIAVDQKLYKEFTGSEVVIEMAWICDGCNETLKLSLDFLNLCKNTATKFRRDLEIQQPEITYFTEETQNKEELDEFDEEDEIPIASIKQQFEEDQSVLEISNCKTKKRTSTKKTDEWQYICDFQDCNMKFNQANTLKCHKRIHTNERPYICRFCSKSFTQNTTLKTHTVAKHMPQKAVECNVEGCTRKFSRNSFLKQHIQRDHLKKRDYQCIECEKNYKQKSHLDRHIEATHKNIRHICEYCSKSFTKSWSLKMHMFCHSENSPYACHICTLNFYRRDKWLKHMTKEHPDVKFDLNPVEIKAPKI